MNPEERGEGSSMSLEVYRPDQKNTINTLYEAFP
jgi:hypothetical protein